MSDLPKCKLCGCEPHRNPDGKLGHKRGSRCKLVSAVYFNDEEWRTLMTQQAGEPVGWCWHALGCLCFSSNSGEKDALKLVGIEPFPVYAAPQAQPALSVDDAIRMDREYIRGLKAGWNMGIVEDTEKFHAAINARLNEINAVNKDRENAKDSD